MRFFHSCFTHFVLVFRSSFCGFCLFLDRIECVACAHTHTYKLAKRHLNCMYSVHSSYYYWMIHFVVCTIEFKFMHDLSVFIRADNNNRMANSYENKTTFDT